MQTIERDFSTSAPYDLSNRTYTSYIGDIADLMDQYAGRFVGSHADWLGAVVTDMQVTHFATPDDPAEILERFKLSRKLHGAVQVPLHLAGTALSTERAVVEGASDGRVWLKSVLFRYCIGS